MNKRKEWKKLSSKIIYKGVYVNFREDRVIRPDGKEHLYAFLQVPKTVGVVPVTSNNEIYLCKQFRYIFQKDAWEIPRGFVDKGETPKAAAERERARRRGWRIN